MYMYSSSTAREACVIPRVSVRAWSEPFFLFFLPLAVRPAWVQSCTLSRCATCLAAVLGILVKAVRPSSTSHQREEDEEGRSEAGVLETLAGAIQPAGRDWPRGGPDNSKSPADPRSRTVVA